MTEELRYQVLVDAKTRDEAIETASEALPRGAQITRVHAENVADREGEGSWLVSLWFSGDKREGPG